jgi:hypothetical protein
MFSSAKNVIYFACIFYSNIVIDINFRLPTSE